MAKASRNLRPEIWVRRTVALVLSPIGLLIISATRLLIISDYNTTTAISIASSGGYVNTLLGTSISLVPLLLPYLAVFLFLIKRFVLSLIAFGAAILISPTRFAPLTVPGAFSRDWRHTLELITTNSFIAIPLAFGVFVTMLLFFERYGAWRRLSFALAALVTLFLIPYVYYMYPFNQGQHYYEDLARQLWIPAETIVVSHHKPEIGYVLANDGNWTVVLSDPNRTISYYRTSTVLARKACTLKNSSTGRPLVALPHTTAHATPPACYRISSERRISPEPIGISRRWFAKTATTSSSKYHGLPGLERLNICASNQVVAMLRVRLHGASAGFRIVTDGSDVMKPGPIRFAPARKVQTFSLTFVQNLGTSNTFLHTFSVEWRSPTGHLSTAQRAAVELRYRSPPHGC